MASNKATIVTNRHAFVEMGRKTEFVKKWSGYNTIRSVFNNRKERSYDYIICGGGTAGSLLANRLTANGDKSVLVLEAGSKKYNDIRIKIPAGILKTFKSEFDWDYESVPTSHTADRPIYLCRGKVLGGSSCTNVLLYNRGDKSDYEAWEKATGDKNWGPEGVLPYFKRSEDDHRGGSMYHGVGGEFSISDVNYQNPLSRTYLSACDEFGVPLNDDFNDWSRPQEGAGRYQVSEKNGVRCSAASAFLEPALSRKNLEISCSSQTSKILFDSSKSAIGVEYIKNGKKCMAKLNENGGEVLLTGGVVNSPQILMLSGVGPQAHLSQHNIPLVHDSIGVGKNLQDHPACVVSYECSDGNAGVSVTSKIRIKGTTITNPKVIAQWLFKKAGPLTSTGCDHGGFFKTKSTLTSPDLQMRFLPAQAITPDGMGTFTKFRETANLKDGFSFQSIAVRPESTGELLLRSDNIQDKPLIDVGYFRSQKDIETMRDGIKLSRKIATTTQAFQPYLGREVYPGESVQSDNDIDRYIRETIHTSNALVGTCKMGAKDDEYAVVDSELKVKGVQNVRVVDASVMPKIPGGQTSAPTVMIGEKGADIILGRSQENATFKIEYDLMFAQKELANA